MIRKRFASVFFAVLFIVGIGLFLTGCSGQQQSGLAL